jgi:hypothetical protein
MTRTIKVHFDGKVFVPDEPVDLPVGTQVEVQIVASTPAERGPLMDLVDWVETLPPLPDSPGDAAAQHDHYLYGTPKRENP